MVASPPARRVPVRDAASLILLRRGSGGDEVLMGRRSARHAFMPSVYVFPGGAVDPADGRAAFPVQVPADDLKRIESGLGSRASPRRTRAIVNAAVRETLEETAIDLASEEIDALRYVGRAITPPGRSRRFDARFLCARLRGTGCAPSSSDELEDVRWLPLARPGVPLATITEAILGELLARLRLDPELREDLPLPFYRAVRGTVRRSEF